MRAVTVGSLVLFVSLAGCLSPDTIEESGETIGELTENVALPTKMSWQELAPMSLPRAEHWACNFDHRIYLIGGFILASPVANMLPDDVTAGAPAGGAPVPTAMVEIYDAKANTMADGPMFPTPIDHAPCVGYNGAIYVFAGANSMKLEPDGDNTWTAIEPAPNAHNAGDVGVLGDKILLIGGGNPNVDIYDPATNSWTTGKNPMPTERGHTAGDVVLGKFYMASGDTGGHAVNTDANEEYDPVTDMWQVKAPIPVKRGSTQAVTWFDRLVILGGQSGQSGTAAYNNVNVYDPVTDAWTELEPMPAGRHGFAAATYMDNIYVFGGAPKQDIYGFESVEGLIVGEGMDHMGDHE